jgi:hypothetical protein
MIVVALISNISKIKQKLIPLVNFFDYSEAYWDLHYSMPVF